MSVCVGCSTFVPCETSTPKSNSKSTTKKAGSGEPPEPPPTHCAECDFYLDPFTVRPPGWEAPEVADADEITW